ncbi:MAG: LysM peptidoglycan-binding domain-containing protein [Chloroflexi bacterium]|nr:LysM peptidoglycan-binding domain-containing protein [Chloroflexota bacterium]
MSPDTRLFSSSVWIVLLVVTTLLPTRSVLAHPSRQEQPPPTPAELIAAVNNLRLSYSLEPLNVHPILMQVAQSQADALAATGGAIGHTRPSGISLTQQLLLLGYPLSGDLTLGGYRSENFVVVPGSSIEEIIAIWMMDELHATTMLSEYRTDIGAGIAFDDEGQTYYVIDTALQTPSGKQQAIAGLILTGIPMTQTSLLGDATQAAQSLQISQYIVPVTRSTARPNGDVIHEVRYGQALWSIAIAYGVKIDQIRRYNNLADTTIYTGQTLLVQKGATQPPATPTATGSLPPTPSPKPASPTLTTTPEPAVPSPIPESSNAALWLKMLAQVILLALFFHGLITILRKLQKKKDE